MSAPFAPTRRGHYNARVRRLFAAPSHAGDMDADGGICVESDVAEGGAGARIRLAGCSDGTVWRRLRFRVFGCPHLIAAAQAACERFEGADVENVRRLPIDELTTALELPAEKAGRLLLLEDGFRALADRHAEALEKAGD